MFRWNRVSFTFSAARRVRFQYNCCFGGIFSTNSSKSPLITFQYNCCFGGILLSQRNSNLFSCFNTTVVSVEFCCSAVSCIIFRYVSIQLLFRWNLKYRLHFRIWSFVSIQLLFRWNVNTIYRDNLYMCFNTTVVSVECCQAFRQARLENTVSIQLLFRWNGLNERGLYELTLFQYNCCFGGIFKDAQFFVNELLFQYNCCFGGIPAQLS